MVFVLDEQTDWRAEGDAVLDSRLDVNEILLVSLCDYEDMRLGGIVSSRRDRFGRTGVVRSLCPGRLLLSWGWISAASSWRP